MRIHPPGPKPSATLIILRKVKENPTKSQSDIARELGVTRQRINGVIKKYSS